MRLKLINDDFDGFHECLHLNSNVHAVAMFAQGHYFKYLNANWLFPRSCQKYLLTFFKAASASMYSSSHQIFEQTRSSSEQKRGRLPSNVTGELRG